MKEYVITIMLLAVLAAFSTPAMADPCVCGSPYNYQPCPCRCSVGDTVNGTVIVLGGETDESQQHSYAPNHQTEEYDLDATGTVKWARLYNHVWGGSEPKYGGVNMTFCNANGQCWDTHPDDGIWCPPINDGPNVCTQTMDKGFYQCGYGTHWLYWNVTDYVTSGYNNATIHTNDYGIYTWDGRVMWMVLVVVFEDPSKPAIRYWVDQGLSKPEYPVIPEAWFNGSINTEANHTLWQVTTHSDDPISIDFNGCELERFSSGATDMTMHTVPASCINPADNNRMIWDHESGSMFPALAVLVEQTEEITEDLIVEEIDVGTPRPNLGFTVTATIKNHGLADITNPFNVSLYVDDVLNSTKQQVSSLNAGSSTPVSFPGVNLPEGCYEFRVFADSDGAITESDDGNNNMTVDGQVGYVIVVEGNSGFVDLLNDPGMPSGSITFDGTTYYIQGMTIMNCAGAGITIEDTTVPFVIKSCTVQNCIGCGVYLGNLTNGKINDSIVKNNTGRGIRVQDPTTCVDITNNTVEENTAYGIEVGWASFSSEENPKFINITRNTCYHNTYGIELIGANCTVAGNIVRDNSADGVYVFGNDSKIYNNIIEDNDNYGIKLYNSSGNHIYWNNFTNNNGGGVQGRDNRATNNWDRTTQIHYPYGGAIYANYTGNHWSDHTTPDSNGDGIVDTPYALDGGAGAEDPYPLMTLPWRFEIPIYENGDDPKNLFSVPLVSSTLDDVIDDPGQGDTVFRYYNDNTHPLYSGYKSAAYYDITWWDAEKVEPIEPTVGYEYNRYNGTFTINHTGQFPDGVDTPIHGEATTGDRQNLLGYASFNNTTLSTTFAGDASEGDTVFRYHNTHPLYQGYKSAAYYDGQWWDAEKVDPIEPGVGYQYDRYGETFNWTYSQ